LAHADRIVRGGGMAPLLDAVDAVHVISSLAGFEALLRGREVTCHGTPFYAGWGLTRDLGAVPARRTRTLTLDALVAGVLIGYPRYLDPVTGLPCPPEVLVSRMASAKAANRLRWIVPLRRWQGRLMKALR
ncbi:MAG: beta-3-deoxy-D-manno-oct-2-ulosonic acid transferase, partial [Novosphingobium sp.]|nr:beta-3-deoxy-D-manno-oct-2-ulosonic acid transferase [Novosphingobium sp.]